jgi:hypothetical protein
MAQKYGSFPEEIHPPGNLKAPQAQAVLHGKKHGNEFPDSLEILPGEELSGKVRPKEAEQIPGVRYDSSVGGHARQGPGEFHFPVLEIERKRREGGFRMPVYIGALQSKGPKDTTGENFRKRRRADRLDDRAQQLIVGIGIMSPSAVRRREDCSVPRIISRASWTSKARSRPSLISSSRPFS